MQNKYERIILVTDSSGTSQAAEESAFELARQHSATVLIVDTVRPPSFTSHLLNSSIDDLFDMVVADKNQRLEKIASQFRDAGLQAETRILFGKSSVQIARIAQTENADLVIRYLKGAKSRQTSPFGNTARNLMRVCPCPLLLVGDKPVSSPQVLACVNVEHSFEENESILAEAVRLAGTSKGPMALSCWKLQGSEILSGYVDQQMMKQYLSEAEQNYRSIFEDFLKKHDLTSFDDRVHLENGDPNQIIPEVCRHESVDVAVMSSASQNHPIRRLLGSTIESVLDDLPCSLLVVKPQGFKSPINPGQANASSSA